MDRIIMNRVTILTMLLIAILAGSTLAIAPTQEAIEKWKLEGVLQQKIDQLKAFRAAGGNQGAGHSPLDRDPDYNRLATNDPVDTINVLVILVDFTDNGSELGYSATLEDFDSLLFSVRGEDEITNPTGSMTDYYFENSYGTVFIQGDVVGWLEMPDTYEYYVGYDNGLTRGRELASDAVVRAKVVAGVDYSKYDNNNDGYCDGVIVVHAGPGGEAGGNDIWSHKGWLYPVVEYDGVIIDEYTMNPEENGYGGSLSPIGVFCHEYGHVLGLPDLYDIDYEPASSDGIGRWSLMASGNYNGGSRTPAHFDGWCKMTLGWVDPIIITQENLYQVEFPAVEYNPVIYVVYNTFSTANEYFLVENRQPYGFDAALPGSGLCIYHVDAYAPGNTNPERYLVAMEQADGNNDLAWTVGNVGDVGDPWPGSSGSREFHDRTIPNTHTNALGTVGERTTQIGFWGISDSDSLMYADIDVSYSRPRVATSGSEPYFFDDSAPGGDGDGILEPGETIKFYCSMTNQMRTTYNARIHLQTNRQDIIVFGTEEADLAPVLAGGEYSNFDPIVFTLAGSFIPSIDSFYMEVVSDSLAGTVGSEEFSQTFGIEVHLGPPQILLVDDDRGEDYDEQYKSIIYGMRIPYVVWHKDVDGSPTGADLMGYPMVFWHTGDSAQNIISAGDVTALKAYLDDGGNLFMSSMSGAADMAVHDGDFLADYLGFELAGNLLWPRFTGVDGSQVGDGTQYVYLSGAPDQQLQLITPTNDGVAEFTLFGRTDVCGVSNHSTHNSVFISFPLEYLSDVFTGFDTRQTLIERVLAFFGGIPTDIDDDNRPATIPESFVLSQNYPNPFNPVTNISYTLRPGKEPTNLSVYNMIGQKVTTLVDKWQMPGHYSITWDGTAQSGEPVATGIYFYRITRGDETQSKKMILLK